MKNFLPLSYIEISEKNLIHNIRQFRNLIKKGTKISVAIKGNAYGHGQSEVAKILEPYVDYFQVNSLEELELLRQRSNKKALVLGYIEKANLRKAILSNCVVSIFSLEQLVELNIQTKILKIKQEIHIPFDAYLGREGFLLADLPKIFHEIKKNEYLKLKGIYAHFANIEDTPDFSHSQKQIDEYERALNLARKFGFLNLETHISASSGVLIYERDKGIHPLVRLGLGAYGLWPSLYLKSRYKNSKFDLKPALSWKTKIAQVRVLPKGRSIGYGLTYITKKKTKIAIIPQGYADGVDRGLSNKGEVLIGGKQCRILGRVMMNMFVVDVSHLRNVKIEDEVVIIGMQGKKKITTEGIAEKLETINYEITTRISPLLPRVIV